jgi:hypothetical protein
MVYDPYNVPNPTNQPLKRKRRLWIPVVAAVFVLCGLGTVISAVASNSHDGKAAADVARAAGIPSAAPHSVPAKPKAAPTAVALGPGDYDVAAAFDLPTNHIKPGTYTVGADGGGHCYWERVRNWDGELTSIIANDNVTGSAKARVTVKKTDAGLHLGDGCVAAIKTGGK